MEEGTTFNQKDTPFYGVRISVGVGEGIDKVGADLQVNTLVYSEENRSTLRWYQ